MIEGHGDDPLVGALTGPSLVWTSDIVGSLGKGGGHGSIIRLIDEDRDGVAEKHTLYAKIDNPRGLISVGDRLYGLHTKWDGKTFKSKSEVTKYSLVKWRRRYATWTGLRLLWW